MLCRHIYSFQTYMFLLLGGVLRHYYPYHIPPRKKLCVGFCYWGESEAWLCPLVFAAVSGDVRSSSSRAGKREYRAEEEDAGGWPRWWSRALCSRGAQRKRAGRAGVSQEHGAKEHNAGGRAAQVCLGNMEPGSTTQAGWPRRCVSGTWGQGARRRRAGRAGVVSGIMRPRITTQADRPRRRGRVGHAAE